MVNKPVCNSFVFLLVQAIVEAQVPSVYVPYYQPVTTTTPTATPTVTSKSNENSSDDARYNIKGHYYYEQKLKDDIYANYDPTTLPYNVNPDPKKLTTYVNVQLQLELHGINYIDIINAAASFKGSIRMWWTDMSIQWNPFEYGGVTQIMVPTDFNIGDYFWIPDITILEDMGALLLSNTKYTNMMLKYDGNLYNENFGEIIVSFNPVTGLYPYDKQTIIMTFGSNSYPKDTLFLTPKNPSFIVNNNQSYQAENIAWKFSSYNISYYDQATELGQQTKFKYQITVQRQATTTMIAVVIPGVLVTFFGVNYWFLPVGDGQRSGFLVTVVLTEVMFLVMLTSFVPLATEIPRVATLFLVYTAFLTIMSALVLCFESQIKKMKDLLEEQEALEADGEKQNDLEEKKQLQGNAADQSFVVKANSWDSIEPRKTQVASNEVVAQLKPQNKRFMVCCGKIELTRTYIRKYAFWMDLAMYIFFFLVFLVITLAILVDFRSVAEESLAQVSGQSTTIIDSKKK